MPFSGLTLFDLWTNRAMQIGVCILGLIYVCVFLSHVHLVMLFLHLSAQSTTTFSAHVLSVHNETYLSAGVHAEGGKHWSLFFSTVNRRQLTTKSSSHLHPTHVVGDLLSLSGGLLLEHDLADARYPGGGNDRSRALGGKLEAVFVQRKPAVFGNPARPGLALSDNDLWSRRNAARRTD